MPVFTCPNGHRWQAPSGGHTPGGTSACPVCGTPTEILARARTDSHVASGTPADSGKTPRWTADPADEAPPHIPGYEILELIGRGGMGIVYRARQIAPERVIALKVIRKERLANAEAVRRFHREAQAAARLAHPNIVTVHAAEQAGDVHFLAMEFVSGVTLQHLVDQHGPLPVAQACDYIRQCAIGLQHAHEQALVHRDIKPGNLMVTVPGRPATQAVTAEAYRGALLKILDMGVARLYQLSDNQEELLSTLTQDGAMLGTPDYIAPEQLEDAHAADIRADLYSLGCTFHFLLTGQVPFPGGTLIQKLDKQRWSTATSVDQLRPEVPSGVAALIRQLMAKDPSQRHQTPAELIAALDELSRTGYVTAAAPIPTLHPVQRLTGHQDAIWSLDLSADGRLALSGGQDRTLRLWEVSTGQQLRSLTHPQEVRGVALSPNGRHALSASGATLRLWDLQTGHELGRLSGHTDTIKSVAIAADGRRALSGGDDRTLRLWDLQTRRELRRLSGHNRDITSVVFCRDGRHALSGSRDQTVRVWDLQTGREVRTLPGPLGLVLSVAVSPDGHYALAGSYDTLVHLWDLPAGRALRRFQGHRQMVSAVAFAPDGRRIVSGSHDHSVRVWELESARELYCCQGHNSWVSGVAFAPDGRHILAAGADGVLCVWHLP